MRRRGKVGIGLGIVALGLVGFYRWQPQRIAFFPAEPPMGPRIDPDAKRLFSKEARIALVVAHPDDAEFYLGGSLLRLHRAGATIRVFCLTDGDKGYYPPGFTDVAANRRVRRVEQTTASAKYGAQVEYFALPDGRLQDSPEVRERLLAALTAFRPEWILAFDPEFPPRIQHSDHLAAGRIAEAIAPRVPGARWLLRYSTRGGEFAIDTSEQWDEKWALLMVHASQFSGKRERIEGLVRGRDEAGGRRFGYALAEPFRVLRLDGRQE